MVSGDTLMLYLNIFLLISWLAFVIGFGLFFNKDTHKHGKKPFVWVLLTVFTFTLAPSIYLFITKRIKTGLFFFFLFPVLFYGLHLGAFYASELIPHTHEEGQGHDESVPHEHEEGYEHESTDSHTENVDIQSSDTEVNSSESDTTHIHEDGEVHIHENDETQKD